MHFLFVVLKLIETNLGEVFKMKISQAHDRRYIFQKSKNKKASTVFINKIKKFKIKLC